MRPPVRCPSSLRFLRWFRLDRNRIADVANSLLGRPQDARGTGPPDWPRRHLLPPHRDLDEEVFPIARADWALDRALTAAAADPGGLAAAAAGQLADALLDRRISLRRCLATLTWLSGAAASRPADSGPALQDALAAAVENELAATEWSGLNADLLAHLDAYAAVR